MRIRYAEVTHIDCQDTTVGGFLRGMEVSSHRTDVTCVKFTGGYKFYCLSRPDEDGAIMLEKLRVEIGDCFRLMVLESGLVVQVQPEKIAHLPARDLVLQVGRN